MQVLVALLLAASADALKVTVLGGSGFTGSRVCKALVDGGAEVVSVSKGGKAPAWAAGEAWASSVDWRSNNLCRGSREALREAVGSPDAVVSCVGAIGFDTQGLLLGNGVANAEGIAAAKAAGASRMAYVGVASEVADAKNWLPGFFSGYFDGKAKAEAALTAAFGEDALVVRPSFVYGGDSFGLFPPRVSDWYGSLIEELLSKGLFVKGADALPGLIGVALRPPVSVDSVAQACADHALGMAPTAATVLDGTAAINGASGVPAASGLSDLIASAKSKLDN